MVQETQNISRSVNNNFIGTYRFANQASKAGVKTFVLISTDKAVRPENIMGATKRMAELAIQALDGASSGTKFSMVRFGNVLNSSGSVIPLFIDQIASGQVTLTHKDVERYFMTIPEASNLVIQAGEMSNGGESIYFRHGRPNEGNRHSKKADSSLWKKCRRSFRCRGY